MNLLNRNRNSRGYLWRQVFTEIGDISSLDGNNVDTRRPSQPEASTEFDSLEDTNLMLRNKRPGLNLKIIKSQVENFARLTAAKDGIDNDDIIVPGYRIQQRKSSKIC